MTEPAEEAGEALGDLIRDLTTEVKGLRSDVKDLAHKYRRSRLVNIVLVLVVLGVGLNSWQNRSLGHCINSALKDRTKVSDTPAQIESVQASADWAQAILGLFTVPPNPTPAQQAAEAKAILQATTDYATHLGHAATVLNSNAAYRATHPLGTC